MRSISPCSYKYRTAAFGDETVTNENKSNDVEKPEVESLLDSISTLVSDTLTVGTMQRNQFDFGSNERKRRQDEHRDKRAT